MNEQELEILLVEDNPGDVVLTQQALRESRIPNHLSVVSDGPSALAFLAREGPFSHVPRPDVVLLDLNLPRLSGREVLQHIKQHQDWKRIPVVMLTTSEAESDVRDAYDRHANCYITKPMSFEPFIDVIRRIEDFWLGTARLPVNRSARS